MYAFMMSAFSKRASRMTAITASSILRRNVAGCRESSSDELLGQRAAALLDLPAADVGERRAQDRRQVDAVVLIELAVLDRLERLGKHCRDLVRRHDDAVLAVHREDAADQERIEPVDRNVHALRVDELADPVAVERKLERACRLQFVREAKSAHVHLDALAASPVGSRAIGRAHREIAQTIELRMRSARRTGSARRRDRPAAHTHAPATSSAAPRTAR